MKSVQGRLSETAGWDGQRPKRALGQNFLINEGIARFQVDAAGIAEGDKILEIGPGHGIITALLLEAAGKEGHVTVIEKDRDLVTLLNERFSREGNLVVIEGDALKVDWPPFDIMVSNIPYNISTPFTMKLLEQDFRKAVVMYQKEFAERLVASPGTKKYGSLSVYAHMRAEIKIIKMVSRGNFRPVPDVDSAAVEIIKRKEPPFHTDMKLFEKVTRAIFSRRRKKIRNAIRSILPRDTDREALESLPHADRRAEELSPREINDITLWLKEMLPPS